MWMIRNKTLAKMTGKRPSREKQWWSENVGWTWADFADVYPNKDRALPRNGEWEEVGGV
jgi:hypothetical protein